MASRTIKLRIPMADLEVYLVDQRVHWNRHESRLFREEDGLYTLTVDGAKGAQFKFFVHVKVGQNPMDVRQALEGISFLLEVTGSGDIDPDSGQPRLWFLIYDPRVFATNSGDFSNNVWGEEDEVIFPTEDDPGRGKQTSRPASPPPKR